MTTILAQGGFNVLQSLQSGFTQLIGYLPQLIGALLVLVIGYIIARVLRAIVTKLLKRLRVDDKLSGGQGGRYLTQVSPQGSPSRLVGTVVFAVVMLFVLSSAIGTLGIPALTGFMNTVLAYLPRVLAALLIFIAAAAVASAVGTVAHRTMGDTAAGRMVTAGAPALVMAIGVFMILTQLRIAPVIVTITYIALVGSIALGSAIAFGLGGRDAAAEMINQGYRRTREETGAGEHARSEGPASGSQSWAMRSGGGGAESESGQTSGAQQQEGGSHRVP